MSYLNILEKITKIEHKNHDKKQDIFVNVFLPAQKRTLFFIQQNKQTKNTRNISNKATKPTTIELYCDWLTWKRMC